MDKKIFWDETRGTVYWIEGDDVMFAPMNNDNTADLGDGGMVEVWYGDNAEEIAQEEARVRAALA